MFSTHLHIIYGNSPIRCKLFLLLVLNNSSLDSSLSLTGQSDYRSFRIQTRIRPSVSPIYGVSPCTVVIFLSFSLLLLRWIASLSSACWLFMNETSKDCPEEGPFIDPRPFKGGHYKGGGRLRDQTLRARSSVFDSPYRWGSSDPWKSIHH